MGIKKIAIKLLEVLKRLETIAKIFLESKPLLTIDEAEIYTSYSKGTIENAVKEGGLKLANTKNVKGQRKFFKKEDLKDWMLTKAPKTPEELDEEARTSVEMPKRKRV